jgi:hypothetical protein
MAIHHITNKMFQDKPPFQKSEVYEKLKELLGNAKILPNKLFFIEEVLNFDN